MEYYILEDDNGYIKETFIELTNEIRHNYTDSVEQARRYENLEVAKKCATFFNCKLIKIIINKEIVKEN